MQIFGLDRIRGNSYNRISCNDRLWTSGSCLGDPYFRNLAENPGPTRKLRSDNMDLYFDFQSFGSSLLDIYSLKT